MDELIIEPGRIERNYWRDVWRYRELLFFLAWRDILVRYKQTVIGVAWAVIRPFLTVLVFTFIFNRVAKLPAPAGVPYPLWQAPGNYIHKLQWEHVAIAEELVRKAIEAADTAVSRRHADIARGLLDQALHSCQFWWASRRPHWDINMIARGLDQQGATVLNAFRSINLSTASEDVKRDAYYKVVASRDIRAKISDQLFWD